MLNIRLLWILFVCLSLSACGGGGTLESGGGSSGSGGTGTTDTYTLALTLTDASGQEVRQVSTAAPGKLRATLKKNNQPLANQLVRFTLDGNVGQLSPTEGTARTNENGIAEIQLQAGETAGSSQVTASYQASDSQTVSSAPYVFDAVVTGGLSAELSVTLLKHDGTIARSVSHFSPGIAEARLLIDGQPGAFQLIQFELGSLGVLNPSNGSAMTDVNGIARIDVIAGTEAGASTLTATFAPTTTQTVSASPFVFTTAGDTPVQGDETAFSINLAMTNQAGNTINQISNAQPGIVVATVRDSLGQPVVNKVVSFVSSLGRIQPGFGTALTNELGQATVTLTAGTISGAGSIEARYQAKTQDLGFTSAGDEVISPYILSLNLKDAANNDIRTVSRTQPGKIQATLTRNGEPVVDELVRFSLDSFIGQLSPASGTARTNANGVAELSLLAGQVAGSGQIRAVVTIDGVNVQALFFVFDSLGDDTVVSALTLSLLDAAGVAVRDLAYATPRKLEALVTENGTPVAFRLVTFSVDGAGEINPETGRAMTDANGIARVDLLAGFVASAGEAQARYTNSEGAEIVSDTFTFTSAGDTPLPGDSPDFTVELRLVSSVSGTDTSEISAANGGQVIATVRDKDANPVVNKVVSFSSSLGSLRPSTGTALTNALGEARISLVAGTAEGAGTVTAQYEAVTSSIGFYTRGDEVDPNQVNATVNFRLLTSCPSDFRTNRDPNNCIETTSISAEQPGILYIEVLREGASTPLAQTLVSATTTLGSISPRTGTAITDANGIALLDLVAGRDVGAGEVSVTALATTRTKAFEIGAVDVDIVVSSSLAVGDTLAAGSTTLISVDISRNGQPYIPPLGVEFTSGCVQAGLAVMDQAVTSIGGVARSTYRASGCVGGDLITATVITGGNTVSGTVVVDVSEAAIGSLEFLDVSAPIIALKGTGGANRTETSIVRFRLIDENGSPVAGRQVDFTLATALGGLELAQTNGFTNGEGIVQTVVRSGIVPTPTRVIARSEQTVTSGTVVVTAPSDVLTVSTGLADQNSFSIARSAFNVHALDFDGNEVDLTVSLADHFNNPVPDGTAVNFIAEGGSVESSCTTTDGRCSVKWRSQNPRPFTTGFANTIAAKCDGGKPCPLGIVRNDTVTFDQPLGGRATILAYSIGEESFADLNGNGRFDTGEYVAAYDLTEAYIDNNEDGQFRGGSCDDTANPCSPATPEGDQFEEFIDYNNDTLFNAANGRYNGLLCRQEDADAGLCTRQLVNVFQNQEIVMSGAEAFFRLTTYAADCSAITGVTATPVRVNSNPLSPEVLEVQSDPASRKLCEVSAIDLSSGAAPSVSLRLFISDIYNNPMPLGTTVAVSADNGVFVGADSYTFPNTTSRVPVSISFGLTREPATGNEKLDGFITINVTSPSGLVSSLSVPVRDDR
ncbi:Ig domain-containing protein [Alishewanella sp. SMS8]|uniref:Ig domain-containing protein n=1 Tax=Alishewanella sp. SMS8 TaxID=2994676 RepID=UPI002741FDDE|nr:Ig domain-containing protein [Alishewanella sp. SMS8]MDP5459830.1 Ig domain-containing protein [Alishewanella sp. SMS8]